MRLRVLAVTAAAPPWLNEAVADYAKRFPREWPFEAIDLPPERRSAKRPVAAILAAEAARIRAQRPREAPLILCDERGEACRSRELAARLAQFAREHAAACFVIGSADGVDPALRAEATWLLALSRLTLPHALAKLVLIEQLYRAVSILRGEPYHRD
ncbi:MAG: 23S rRNA (pseudouridine(1915)-N(3))-methyltransferase RlmH [Casimicrobiaceae bacterium]|nr:23S rRNA (pseudouridine(1915)-N(3))-methyltransferase RlmH [Casimicrobiaceae bacterium]MCX8099193.1 23S rRNA (pseudouridine(1915)-N(3))-methyltransferase RlmH [Casimicrobiaceae bacterium]MDW8311433.1 23S rRNA (pseudouridine(1915)-N(3))-methyltransferase RlmH [Burkholderiales bacterium]